MKVILLANHIYAIPTLNLLASKGMLLAVVLPETIHEYNLQVEKTATFCNIQVKRFSKIELSSLFKDWLIEQNPDIAIAYTFAYKIPKVVLGVPLHGFLNVHYSILPAYKGSFPVFWQIKCNEIDSGISIHKMDENFDSGPVLLRQSIPILPGETQGLYSSKLSLVSVNLIDRIITQIENLKPEQIITAKKQSYFPKPSIVDIEIYWDKCKANEVEDLVNACNPEIGGALTQFRGQVIKILEVVRVNQNGGSDKPGTIIYADYANGIYVACLNKEILKVNVVQIPEGIFSGNKFAAMGIQVGEKFGLSD